MLSIKEYAVLHNVSYEAVRKQVKRYSAELEGHIQVVGRTQFLDDVAVAFLDDKRVQNPVVIYEASKDEEIDRLQQENKALLMKLAEKQEKIELLQDRLLEAAEVPKQLVSAQSELAMANQEIARLQQELSDASQKISEAELSVSAEPAKRRFWDVLFRR